MSGAYSARLRGGWKTRGALWVNACFLRPTELQQIHFDSIPPYLFTLRTINLKGSEFSSVNAAGNESVQHLSTTRKHAVTRTIDTLSTPYYRSFGLFKNSQNRTHSGIILRPLYGCD
jgi:hypothetical protein